MKIAIIVNRTKRGSEETTREIVNRLSEYSGVAFYVADGLNDADGLDYIFVVGGDGTMLMTVDGAVKTGTPVICFNTGRVGFLSEVSDISNIADAVERILSGEYEIENRALLETTYHGVTHYALNDIAITKSSDVNVIRVYVGKDGKIISGFSADGIMLSTPTGSTAYSLSCGGPILEPTMRAMLMTPVCAHVLFSRPMVFGDERLVIGAETEGSAVINIDGRPIERFSGKGELDVRLSQKVLKLIKISDSSFYKKLQEKLLQWTVENNS